MVAGGKYQVLRTSGRARGFPRVSTRAWWSGKAFWPVMQGSVPGRGSRSPEALRPDGVACEEQQGSGRGQEMSSERWPPRARGWGRRAGEGRAGAAEALTAGGAVPLSRWYFPVLARARHGDTMAKGQMPSVC